MRRFAFVLVCAMFALALPAHAQLGLLGTGGSVAISLMPAHPGPNDAVKLTAHSPVFDLVTSTLVWSIDGKVITQGVGADTTALVAGGLGSQTEVVVHVTARDGTTASQAARIVPTELDLLSGSDSYTPPFYRGKALPSAGSSVSLQAIPRFIRPDGSAFSVGELMFTWKKNGQVMGNLSGTGKSAIIIPSPVLYGRDTVSVLAASSDGVYAGEAFTSIAAVDPMIVLYEDHPLYGVLLGDALGASAFIPESEMTFAAIPYFASVSTPSDPLLQYAWRVNGKNIAADTKAPNEITLQSASENTLALIELALTHATNFFLNASRVWTVTFSSGGTMQDEFHSGAQ